MRGNAKRGYRFIRVIGEGAFSRVYLAEAGDGRRYACKISGELKMLEREAEMLSRLYHPMFPAYIDYVEKSGEGMLVMEYISGESLGQLLQLRGGLSARQTIRIARELADGLQYLQERQPAILYRDLKPENIMVCQDGHIKLVDFGCACYQTAQSRARVGTPGFAPPEQLIEGGTAGLYSDVYGMGRVLQSVMTDSRKDRRYSREKRRYNSEWRKFGRESRYRREERKCGRLLQRTIAECTKEDPRQRPQDMISVIRLLTGKGEKEGKILCEKNIWESSYKNSCSLPSI